MWAEWTGLTVDEMWPTELYRDWWIVVSAKFGTVQARWECKLLLQPCVDTGADIFTHRSHFSNARPIRSCRERCCCKTI